MPTQTKTLKIPVELHADLKHTASTPPSVPINELGSRLIAQGLKAMKAKQAKGGGHVRA